jgi:spoIIIJ-associated protein
METEVVTETETTGETWVEGTGPTVDDAVAKALDQLGIPRDAAEIDVLASGGARAVPGESLSGAEAKVRVRQLDAHTLKGRQLLEELLQKMDIPVRITVRRAETSKQQGEAGAEAPVVLDVSGDDLGLLIGWRGETLRGLQTVLNLMMGDAEREGRKLIIDIERYRARREEQVKDMALRAANRAMRQGGRLVMEPMQPYERRAIHLALESESGVTTESEGEEPERRVVIIATGPAQPDLPPLPGSMDRGRGGPGGGRDGYGRGPRRR